MSRDTTRSIRALRTLCVAIALLVAQAAGFAHSLGHIDRSKPDAGLGHSQQCDWCHAYSVADGGVANSPVALLPVAPTADLPQGAPRTPLALAHPFYFLTRAPPTPLL